MKTFFKISTYFLFAMLPLFVAAQTNAPFQEDEEMNLFLLVLASVFMAAMLGATISGAFLAALAIFLFFSFTALGMVSTSVAIGLYKRSFTAGFKSFFLLFFSITAAVLGTGILFLLNLFVPLSISSAYLALIGFFGGLAGGFLLGRILFHIVKEMIAALAQRLKIT